MIIVDDERIIRESLNKFIDWNSVGVEIVGLADNGSTAVDLILKIHPDIILSDISMPKLDGIEMTALLRQHNIDAEIIFISAYSSFDYAKRALQYGAFDYVLKPIDEAHLLQIIQRCVEKIKSTRINNQIRSQFVQKQQEELKVAVRHLLCSEEITQGDSDILLSNNITEKSCKYAISAGMWYHRGKPQDINAFEYLIKKFEFSNKIFCIPMAENLIVLICFDPAMDPNQLERNFYTYLQRIKRDQEQDGAALIVTMSMPYPFKEAFQYLYTQISISFVYDGFNTAQTIRCFSTLIRQSSSVQPEEVLTVATQMIKANRPEDVLNGIRTFFLQMTANGIIYDMSLLKLKCIDLIDVVIRQLSDYQIKGFLNQDSLTGKKNINSQRTVDKIYEVTRNIIINLTSCIREIHSKSTNHIVMLALEYVHQNYNKDISLTQLADQLYVSPNYLSKIFSAEVKQTFSHYLLEYRVEESKKLIMNPKNKIYEVAEMTGFSDVAHFSKSFKQIVGVSPHQYKNN